MFQQRWRSKRLLRGYHGDWIPERRFKRWFLPTQVPSFAPTHGIQSLQKGKGALPLGSALNTPVPPVANLFMRDVERRLDVVVFRTCFAHSVYYARTLILHGKVLVNGFAHRDPNLLLNEGDLISVDPESVPMLNKHVAKRVQADRERLAPSAPVHGAESEAGPKMPDGETLQAAEATQEENAQSAEGDPSILSGDVQVGQDEATKAGAQGEPNVKTDGATEEPVSSSPESTTKPDAFKQHGNSQLPPGVLPFNLPPFAAPFLFVPPYLDVSFRTCSAIYLRHPTLTTRLVRNRDADRQSDKPRSEITYQSDIPSPYPAGGEMFGLAWELYVRNAPRVRADERRTKLEGRFGRSGFVAARSWEQDRRRVAVRRGWGRKRRITLPGSPLLRGTSKNTP